MPAEDEPVLDTVVLTVSASPGKYSTRRSGTGGDEGSHSTEVVHISGERYLNSLACGYQYVEKGVWPGGVQYDLGRNYTTLSLTAGLSDLSEHTDADVVLEVVGDGRALIEKTLSSVRTMP